MLPPHGIVWNGSSHFCLVSYLLSLECSCSLTLERAQAGGGHIYNVGFNVGGDGVTYEGGYIGFNGEKFVMREGEAEDVSGNAPTVLAQPGLRVRRNEWWSNAPSAKRLGCPNDAIDLCAERPFLDSRRKSPRESLGVSGRWPPAGKKNENAQRKLVSAWWRPLH